MKDLYKQFNLPSYIKNKSFADASKLIENKFKDRNDKTSLNTKGELMQRLADAQEYLKMQQGLAANAESVPDMNEGQVPEGMEQFFLGGAFNNYDDVEGLESLETTSSGTSALNGLSSGAQTGSMFGPWGTLIGAGVGAIGGLVGGDKKNAAINKAKSEAGKVETFNSMNKYNSDFAYGGNLDDIFKVNDDAYSQLANPSATMADPLKPNKTKFGKQIAGDGDWLNSNAGNILSYAPILGNAIELSKLKKSNTERGNRLDNTYDKQLFDRNSLFNRVNQNNVNGALAESSGGDLGALRSNILAANLNKNKATSDALIKGDGINRGEERFQFSNNLRKDQINTNLNERYIERKDRDEGAYQSAKSNLTRSLYEDVGKVGQDIVNKKLVKEMFGYTWDGRYYVDPNGNKLTKEEMAIKAKANKENQNAYGGYLKR